ncbi:MAG: response regulator [Roseiflexaceae bacterium]|nr:response regulator [Roseiflexaceae bacterium]
MVHQPTILIVDDEPNQRFILEQALQMLADTWKIIVVTSAIEALAQIEQQLPDLIITDYHMPGMTGIELIEQVRKRQIRMPIILMTAYNTPEVQIAARRLGVDHALTKPVSIALLRQLTTEALSTT